MAHESIILELRSSSDWDGVTATALSRDDATVVGKRYFKFDLSGAHGYLEADLGGLFSPVSAKLVGIAYSSWNPMSRARVIAPDGAFRQEISLKPDVQYVVMQPHDTLAFFTTGSRKPVYLTVNELNEADAVTWGLQHQPYGMPTRFRIVRQTAVAFAANAGSVWTPSFAYDDGNGLLIATDDGTGMIPASQLCHYPSFQDCYVTVRFAGATNNSKVHLVDGLTRRTQLIESSLDDVTWSKVFSISHDDGIALEATAAGGVTTMVCDIRATPVAPGDQLRGRYERGL